MANPKSKNTPKEEVIMKSTETAGEDTSVVEPVESPLDELRSKADALGVKYSPNIGEVSLKKKIDDFITSGSAGLDDKELVIKDIKDDKVKSMKDKALHRRKVQVTNLDPKESEFTTAYGCVINDDLRIAMVIRLNQPIGLEQCLIDQLRVKRIQKVMPEVDEHTGKATGNFVTQAVAHYNVEFLED